MGYINWEYDEETERQIAITVGLVDTDDDGVPLDVICARCGHANAEHDVSKEACCHGDSCDCQGFVASDEHDDSYSWAY